MRLPFSSRNRGPENNVESEASRRSSLSDENGPREIPQTGNNDDHMSERSTAQSNATPLDTPATSFSSYNSGNGNNGEKSGMYKLSGMQLYFKRDHTNWVISC